MNNKKNIIITGCIEGIGSKICEYFNKKNWNVIGIDIRKKPKKNNYINDFYKCNISNIVELIAILKKIKNKYKNIDSIVNNAAKQICKSIPETTNDEWNEVMDTNLKAPYVIIKELYKNLKNAQGSIVNISSVHAKCTSKKIGAYATSKGAISAMTRSLAIDLASDNIRVNAVLPGAIDTEMLRSGLTRNNSDLKESMQNLSNKTPLNKIGKPEDIAQIVYFLCDPELSSFITGQEFIVDGGATIKLGTE